MPNDSTKPDNPSTCVLTWTGGSQRLYQERSRSAFEVAGDVDLSPHAWIRSTCGNECLNPQHLIAHQPRLIAYPPGVCVYCGMPAGTKDHLIPRPWTGDARRSSVAVVPSCAECNSWIGASGEASIAGRRKIAHASLRKAKRQELAAPEWTSDDLAELGPALRQHVQAKQRARLATLARLAWPDDPFYDMRAWQKSGIDDPVALGVVDPIAPEHRPPMLPATADRGEPVHPRRDDSRERLVAGCAFRRRRNELGLTQERVAQGMRDEGFTWHAATVCGFEAGKRRARPGEREALLRVLGGGW